MGIWGIWCIGSIALGLISMQVTLSNLQHKTWEISKILRDFREETIYLYTRTSIGILHKVLDAQAFLGGLQSLQWLAHRSVSCFRYDSADVSTAFFKQCTSASRAIRYVHIYILSFDELTTVATHAFAKAHAARAKTVLFMMGLCQPRLCGISWQYHLV